MRSRAELYSQLTWSRAIQSPPTLYWIQSAPKSSKKLHYRSRRTHFLNFYSAQLYSFTGKTGNAFCLGAEMGAKKLNPKIQQMCITCFWGGARLVFCREWWGGFLSPGGEHPWSTSYPCLPLCDETNQWQDFISSHPILEKRKSYSPIWISSYFCKWVE